MRLLNLNDTKKSLATQLYCAVSKIAITKYLLKFNGCSNEAPHKVKTNITSNKPRIYLCTYPYTLLAYNGTTTSTRTIILGIMTCRNIPRRMLMGCTSDLLDMMV